MRTTFAITLLLFALSQPPAGYSRRLSQPARQEAANAVRLSLRPNEGVFLILTDIHFDPFSTSDSSVIGRLVASRVEKWQAILEAPTNQAPSAGGEDTNYPLLAAALRAAKDSGVHYDYVIVLGDYLGHEFGKKYRDHQLDAALYQDFVVKTELFVSRMIRQTFPSVPIYSALGNNDSTRGDYAAPGNSLLAALSKEWSVVASDSKAVKTFRIGGYYAAPHPTVPTQEFIILNTAFWSSRYQPDSASTSTDSGAEEMSWLKSELGRLRSEHKSASLILHIPVGIDAYTSSTAENCDRLTLFWKAAYESSFLQIIDDSKDLLRDGYAGHTHMDDFRVLSDGGIPYFQMHIASAISRDRGNDPGFEIGVYDKANGDLNDIALVFLTWSRAGTVEEHEYDFRQLSGFPAYSPAALETLNRLVLSNAWLRARFMDFFLAHTSVSSAALANWRSYACAQTEMTATHFVECACHASP